jgi:hypothetical protein
MAFFRAHSVPLHRDLDPHTQRDRGISIVRSVLTTPSFPVCLLSTSSIPLSSISCSVLVCSDCSSLHSKELQSDVESCMQSFSLLSRTLSLCRNSVNETRSITHTTHTSQTHTTRHSTPPQRHPQRERVGCAQRPRGRPPRQSITVRLWHLAPQSFKGPRKMGGIPHLDGRPRKSWGRAHV